MSHCKSFFFVFLATVLPLAASADDIVKLKNGKEIRGVIVDETATEVEISSQDGKKFTFSKSKIAKITRETESEGRKAEKVVEKTEATEVVEEMPVSSSSTTPYGTTGPFGLGLILGTNAGFASLEPTTLRGDGRLGLLAGLLFDIKLVENFYLQPEIAYVEHGYVLNQGLTSETTVKYDTFEMPVYLKVKFGLGRTKRVHVFGLLGPTFGLRVNAKSVDSTSSTDISSSTKSFAFALNFGGGVEIWLSERAAFLAGLRFSYGLTNVSTTTGSSVKNRDLQAVVGMKFGF